MLSRLTGAGLIAAGTLFAASPALAGVVAPAPILGAGLPALALFAGGYYLVKKRRSR